MTNDPDRHALGIGLIVVNLHSLEYLLRVVLLKHDGDEAGMIHGPSVGDKVPANAFTDYATLGEAIARYNALARPLDPDLAVDDAVVDLRDSLAHGRVASRSPTAPMRLLKFAKPKNGKATVTHAITMDESWFAQQRTFVYQQAARVEAGAARLGVRLR